MIKTLFKAIIAIVMTGVAARAGVNITMWGVDQKHSSLNSNETILSPGLIAASGTSFGLRFSQQVNGEVYAQPLLMSGLNVSGTIHTIVYIVTEKDDVYAFDADDNTGANANPIWHDSLLPGGATPVSASYVSSVDPTPYIGITGTPVIDATNNTIYVASKIMTGGSAVQYLHALDLVTGMEKFGGPVVMNPTFSGNGSGVAGDGQGGVVSFNPRREAVRSALALYNGVVYVTWASHDDTTPYHGEIVGYNETTLAQVSTFISTPNGVQAGLWQSGANPAFDGTGNMYVGVGNGSFDQNHSAYTTQTDWGECMLKLPTNVTGSINLLYSDPTRYFCPINYDYLNEEDLDVGSGGLLLLPDQVGGSHPHLIVGGGKGGVLYLVDRDNLGGLGTSSDTSVQEINEVGGALTFATPAYFNGSIYYAPAGGSLTRRTVGYNSVTGNYLSDPPVRSSATFSGNGSGAFITSSGTSNGVVWILNSPFSGAGQIGAFDPSNITSPLFAANTTLSGSTCTVARFAVPMAANGKVYFSAYDTNKNGHLFVYGAGLYPVSAVSQRTHGSAGTFGIPINMAAGISPAAVPAPVECRGGGALSLAVTFNTAIASGSAAVTSGVAQAGAPTFSGATMTIPLTNVTNAQELQIQLTNLKAVNGSGLSSVYLSVGVLAGDTTGDGVVNGADMLQTQSLLGQPVSGANFRNDVTLDGVIGGADMLLIKSQNPSSIP